MSLAQYENSGIELVGDVATRSILEALADKRGEAFRKLVTLLDHAKKAKSINVRYPGGRKKLPIPKSE